MLSLTKIFYCLTKNVNLKSRPSENLLADFCTSESSKNQPGGHSLTLSQLQKRKFTREFSHGINFSRIPSFVPPKLCEVVGFFGTLFYWGGP